jgi:hypothetical protein
MSTKVGCAVKPSKPTSDLTDYGDCRIAWISLDPETDRGEHGLTPLLLHRLGHEVDEEHRTFAQLLAQKLIDLALGGHFPSLEEILIRIDGDAKTRSPAARSENIELEFDELMARRILDAYHDKREGPPCD